MEVLDGADERSTAVIYSPTSHTRVEELPLFKETETVSGKVSESNIPTSAVECIIICVKVVVSVKKGKSLQHMGIRIEFIGAIEMYILVFSLPFIFINVVRLYDRESSQEFTSLVRELEEPGVLVGTKQYPFAFTQVEKAYDTYNGVNVSHYIVHKTYLSLL